MSANSPNTPTPPSQVKGKKEGNGTARIKRKSYRGIMDDTMRLLYELNNEGTHYFTSKKYCSAVQVLKLGTSLAIQIHKCAATTTANDQEQEQQPHPSLFLLTTTSTTRGRKDSIAVLLSETLQDEVRIQMEQIRHQSRAREGHVTIDDGDADDDDYFSDTSVSLEGTSNLMTKRNDSRLTPKDANDKSSIRRWDDNGDDDIISSSSSNHDSSNNHQKKNRGRRTNQRRKRDKNKRRRLNHHPSRNTSTTTLATALDDDDSSGGDDVLGQQQCHPRRGRCRRSRYPNTYFYREPIRLMDRFDVPSYKEVIRIMIFNMALSYHLLAFQPHVSSSSDQQGRNAACYTCGCSHYLQTAIKLYNTASCMDVPQPSEENENDDDDMAIVVRNPIRPFNVMHHLAIPCNLIHIFQTLDGCNYDYNYQHRIQSLERDLFLMIMYCMIENQHQHQQGRFQETNNNNGSTTTSGNVTTLSLPSIPFHHWSGFLDTISHLMFPNSNSGGRSVATAA